MIKTGRTHLQDATPIRLGQVFEGYAGQIERGIAARAWRKRSSPNWRWVARRSVPGSIRRQSFPARVIERLARETGLELRETSNHFQAQSTLDGVVAASGELRTIAVSLMKIANDIRWMGSGPRAGIGELAVPAVQPGHPSCREK